MLFFLVYSDKKSGTLVLVCELMDMNIYELIRGEFSLHLVCMCTVLSSAWRKYFLFLEEIGFPCLHAMAYLWRVGWGGGDPQGV